MGYAALGVGAIIVLIAAYAPRFLGGLLLMLAAAGTISSAVAVLGR